MSISLGHQPFQRYWKQKEYALMSSGDNVLISGPSRLTGQSLSGQTVAAVRRTYKSTLNIPDGATATINGINVPETQVITNGEELVFAKPLGAKGL